MPTLYIIAGPNGAGKTTASQTLLPEVFHTSIFINADEIAFQLNPSNVQGAAIRAGRIMLLEIEKRLFEQTTFSIETTLATRSYLNLVRRAQFTGYEVVLFFFYLSSVNLAKQRVALRVSKGGHNIPEEVIERRYVAGLRNLFEFIKIVDQWFIYENTNTPAELIADGELGKSPVIRNFESWKKLKQ
ncbi:MAG TPA: zeta toxin family protein [Parafilimonas sp.]|nr:zeta toxin family protein [Parafilimonas sp.]